MRLARRPRRKRKLRTSRERIRIQFVVSVGVTAIAGESLASSHRITEFSRFVKLAKKLIIQVAGATSADESPIGARPGMVLTGRGCGVGMVAGVLGVGRRSNKSMGPAPSMPTLMAYTLTNLAGASLCGSQPGSGSRVCE